MAKNVKRATKPVPSRPKEDPKEGIKQGSNALVPPASIGRLVLGAEAQVEKADILAIAITKFEDRVNEEIHKADNRLRAVQAEHDEHRKRFQETCEAFAAQELKAKTDRMLEAYKQFAGEAHVELSVTPDTRKRLMKVSLKFYSSKRKDSYSYSGHESYSYTNDLDFQEILVLSDQLRESVAVLDREERQVQALQQLGYQWRQKKTDMNRTERRVRARLAEITLNKSDEGQEILQQLTEDFDAFLQPPDEGELLAIASAAVDRDAEAVDAEA